MNFLPATGTIERITKFSEEPEGCMRIIMDDNERIACNPCKRVFGEDNQGFPEFTVDETSYYLFRQKDKFVFLLFCPPGATIKTRTVYSSARENVLSLIKKAGVEIHKKFEIYDTRELESLQSKNFNLNETNENSVINEPFSNLYNILKQKPKPPRRSQQAF